MALRDDEQKLDWSLLPVEPLEEAIRVLMFGAKKYSRNNWKEPPYFDRASITNSLLRHQSAIAKGEIIDSESGLRHSAHVLVNAMFQSYYETNIWANATPASSEFSIFSDIAMCNYPG